MSEQDLTDLAAKVAKHLRWVQFLLALAALLTLLDWQLKRSMSRIVVQGVGQIRAAVAEGTARLIDDLIGGGNGRQPVGESAGFPGEPGSGGGAGVVGDAPGGAADGHADGQDVGAPAAAQDGPVKRQAGDGRRAGRAGDGS